MRDVSVRRSRLSPGRAAAGFKVITPSSTAHVIGILFIIATVALSVSVVLLEPVLGASNYLLAVFDNGQLVAAATSHELTNHVAVIALAVVTYPIFKAFSERLSIGYVAARAIESAFFATGRCT